MAAPHPARPIGATASLGSRRTAVAVGALLPMLAWLTGTSVSAGQPPPRLTQLTHGSGGCPVGAPLLSADGRQIVVGSSCDLAGENPGRCDQIFRLDVSSGTATQLTQSAACNSVATAASDDLGAVMLASNCPYAPGNADRLPEIFVLEPASRMIRQLTDEPYNCGKAEASISGDGTLTAFAHGCGDGIEVSVVATAGGPLMPVTETFRIGTCGFGTPALSADGRRVAFSSDCPLDGPGLAGASDGWLYLLDIPAGARNRLAMTCAPRVQPSVSADGRRIAYASRCDLTGGNGDGSQEIFLVDDGGGVTQLTDGAEPCVSRDPALTPDGALVAFTSTCNLTGGSQSGRSQLFLADTRARSIAQLTSAGFNCLSSSPAPSDDGRRIAFLSNCNLTGENPQVRQHQVFVAMLDGATPTPTPVPTPTAPARCGGDCDGGGTISVDELVRGVNIALGTLAVAACPSFDLNADGAVTIDELIRALNNALAGCA